LRETGSHETAARAAASVEEQDEDGQRLWQAILMLMVVSLVAEGAMGRLASR
jgi:hypothetical protein